MNLICNIAWIVIAMLNCFRNHQTDVVKPTHVDVVPMPESQSNCQGAKKPCCKKKLTISSSTGLSESIRSIPFFLYRTCWYSNSPKFHVSPRWAQDFPKRLLQCCPVAVAMFCCGKSSVAEPVVYRRDVPIRGAPPNSDHSVPFRVADVWRVIFRWVYLLGNQKGKEAKHQKIPSIWNVCSLCFNLSPSHPKKTGHENSSQNPRPLCFLRSLVGASPKRLGHWFYRSASGRRCFQPNFRSRRLRGWEASSGVGSGATTAGAAVEICRVSGGGKQVVEVWGSSRNRETKVVIVGRKLVWIFFVFFFGGHGWVFGGMRYAFCPWNLYTFPIELWPMTQCS